ncbi:hypothetical protein WS67_02230 [Burkholderia singularis]|uniref:Uncharacterized protein n=1 Tax=Burkholderia singularis TaxID=1503053 RepID=A0A103DV64_9BURK|nr:hypothetical protein [Burkholderia singularis]KVE23321.1 hypothetical protein WS67_02230 [Burkholderia singularis]
MQELTLQEIDLVGGAQTGGGLIGGLTGLIGIYGQGLYDLGAVVTDTLAGGLIGAGQIVLGLPGQVIGGIVNGITTGVANG